MAAVTIRKLSEESVRRWKAHAEGSGRSMEAELRDVIEAGPPGDPESPGIHDPEALKSLEAEAETLKGSDGKFLAGPRLVDYMRRWQQAVYGDRLLPDSTPMIRKSRYDDDPTAWDGT